MKKILLSVLFIISLVVVNAQFANQQTIGSNKTLFKSLGGLGADSSFILLNSYADTAAANQSVSSKYNGSFIRVGTTIYYRTLVPLKWNALTSGASGTYLATADTSTMLSKYTRTSDTAQIVANRLKVSDTATMLSARPLNNRFLDSIAVIRSLAQTKGVGTLIAVATNTGSGISGGTITTSGTLVIDTLNISTRAWRKKGTDSVSNLVNVVDLAKINKSDSLSGGYTTWLLTKKKIDSIAALIGSGSVTGSGTTSYVPKWSSSSALTNSLIYDNGTNVVIGGTSGSSLFNIIGQQGITNTTTHSSGTATAFGVTATTTYSGALPSSNASFSSIVNNHASIFNGNSNINGNTPFGSSLPSSIISFSSGGTVALDSLGTGVKTISALIASSFDNGSINGTVTKTSGIQINGIFKVSGATATITRTKHYQLLINSINEFGFGGDVTSKYAIYQAGSADSNYLAGNLQLPNLGSTTGTTMVVDASGNVFKLTSSRKYKENIVDLDTNKLQSFYSLKGKNYNYIKDNKTTAGIIAEEVDSLGLKDLVVYKDGKPDGLNYQAFTPYIIELLKSQKLEIEMLKKEIIILKNKK